MKILHTLAQLPTRTGSGVYFSNLLAGLKREGVENRLLYAVQDPYEFHFEEASYPVRFLSEELPFPIAGMSDEMPYPNTVYSAMDEETLYRWKAAFRRRLDAIKSEFTPDVIVAHHLWYLTNMVIEAFPGVPVVGIAHGTDLRQAENHEALAEAHAPRIHELAHVFALSRKDKAGVSRIFQIPEERITVMGGGYNESVFNDQGIWREEEIIKIVYAGKLSRAKGVYELAKAYPNLKRKYPEITMEFIGEESLEHKDRIFECAHYKEGFRIHNVIDQKALGAHMKTCDIFVLPSYYEGLGLTAIEALACRMRLVTAELDGLMELLGNAVVNADEIEIVKLPNLYELDKPYKLEIDGYVERLEEAIEKQILRLRQKQPFSDAVYDKIRNHSWRRIVEREYEKIKEIAESSGQ
ncbi:Glycogen synthase [Aedoeadaptatus ivorii]|uniref:Glycogen synthase n=1 Tax=Aedoeadaptatus ivorii TaxID=54006 RepID=A0A3S5C2U2_9FIRM|nr:glycosyltransferase [Peptoniphilus ivorii]VEJ36175.1 Glycogen synthase [Peptoniphilus ivorii]